MAKRKFRKITAILTSIGVFFVISSLSMLILSEMGIINLLGGDVRTYSVEFYNDGALVYSKVLNRGDRIEYGTGDQKPKKSMDADGSFYTFLGWDYTGDGLIDVTPTNAYFSFSAEAIYSKNKSLSDVDYYKLAEMLEDGSIDIESFLNLTGLDEEEILKFLSTPVFKYKTSYDGLIYFKTESMGNYDASRKKWLDCNYYPQSNISNNSINPQSYSANKISNVLKTVTKSENSLFGVSIEYLRDGDKYPVPAYEINNNEDLDSDAYSLKNPVNKKYYSTSTYAYGDYNTISTASKFSYTTDAIRVDELKYRDYAYTNYLKLDEKYKEHFLNICANQGIRTHVKGKDDYKIVDEVRNYFAGNFKFSLKMGEIDRSEDPIIYFMNESKEGIGKHFATSMTMMYRALGIPARYVQGYVDYCKSGNTYVEMPLAKQHAWTEIYIDNLGWIIEDSAIEADASEFSESLFDQFNSDFRNEILEGYGNSSKPTQGPTDDPTPGYPTTPDDPIIPVDPEDPLFPDEPDIGGGDDPLFPDDPDLPGEVDPENPDNPGEDDPDGPLGPGGGGDSGSGAGGSGEGEPDNPDNPGEEGPDGPLGPGGGGGSGGGAGGGGMESDGNVSTNAPGDEGYVDEFEFSANYDGSAYLRTKSFENFDAANNKWTTSNDDDFLNDSRYNLSISPLEFSYYAASGLYDDDWLMITSYFDLTKALVAECSNSNMMSPSLMEHYMGNSVPKNETYYVNSRRTSATASSLNKMRDNLSEKYPAYADELDRYSEYVDDHYLNVDSKYVEYFTDFAKEQNIDENDPEIIIKVANTIKNWATYSLTDWSMPSGADPILHFMEAKVGICNNFASATVMMYRSLGIPARYVTGFAGKASSTETTVVNSGSRHAWTEVFVDGVGWVMVDSTGSTANDTGIGGEQFSDSDVGGQGGDSGSGNNPGGSGDGGAGGAGGGTGGAGGGAGGGGAGGGGAGGSGGGSGSGNQGGEIEESPQIPTGPSYGEGTPSLSPIVGGDDYESDLGYSISKRGEMLVINRTYNGRTSEFIEDLLSLDPNGLSLNPGDRLVIENDEIGKHVKTGVYSGILKVKILSQDGRDNTNNYGSISVTLGGVTFELKTSSDGTKAIRVEECITCRYFSIVTESHTFKYNSSNTEEQWWAKYKWSQAVVDEETGKFLSPGGLCPGDTIAILRFENSISSIQTVSNTVDCDSLLILNEKGEDVTSCYIVEYTYGTLMMTR